MTIMMGASPEHPKMQFKGFLYLLFCVLCGAKPPGGGSHDVLHGAEDDDPLSSSSSDNDEHLDHRPVPIHSFEGAYLKSVC